VECSAQSSLQKIPTVEIVAIIVTQGGHPKMRHCHHHSGYISKFNMYLCGKNDFRTSTKKNIGPSSITFARRLWTPFTCQQENMKI